jgi:hypothetical protein
MSEWDATNYAEAPFEMAANGPWTGKTACTNLNSFFRI